MDLTLLYADFMGKPVWMWAVFVGVVLALLVMDLGLFHKENKEIGVRESLKLSAFYIGLGVAFGGWVWFELGQEQGVTYLTAFVVEKTLAMDNVFVIAMIFSYFAVPRMYQHRVLFWGILGVIILRGIMIGLGATLVQQFGWILYIFAVFLIFTGVKMLLVADKEETLEGNRWIGFLKKHLRVTEGLHGEKFFVRRQVHEGGPARLFATPLFLALVVIEFADVIFAVDSVPAIFALTTDPYIVYTSNIFAILGLRALYFALAAMIERFRYLKVALSVVLIFIGAKIFLADLLGLEKIPPMLSLGVVFSILAAGMVYSLWRTREGKA
jgi:tellurite resistance protein TerC